MIYLFKCELCGKSYEKEKGMNDIFSEEDLTCKKKKCLGHLYRDYTSEMGDKGIIIPENMKAINSTEPEIKYDKSPSGKKHFW